MRAPQRGGVEHFAALQRGRRGSDQEAHALDRLARLAGARLGQEPLVEIERLRAFDVRDQLRNRIYHRWRPALSRQRIPRRTRRSCAIAEAFAVESYNTRPLSERSSSRV